MKIVEINTLIIGASASGLACAAHLKNYNISYEIIDKSNEVGDVWSKHYDRLHLHTFKSRSHLPFIKFSKDVPKFPSKNDVVDYLKNYADKLDLKPKFKTKVISIQKEGTGWKILTSKQNYYCSNLIVCTGNNNKPNMPQKKGLDSFTGSVIHGADFCSGKEFNGKNVLVVGFGNSACEIAMCLHNHGVKSSLSVRSAVNVIPRELARNIIIEKLRVSDFVPYKILDRISAFFIDRRVGDVSEFGLKKLSYGPLEQILKHHKVPLIDIGAYELIKSGKITVYGDVKKIEKGMIYFSNDLYGEFDVIIMGTGYSNGLENIIKIDKERTNDLKLSISKRKYFGDENIYFCGFHVSPLGMLREIRKESKIISKSIYNNRIQNEY